MTPEQAKFLHQLLLPQLGVEQKITRKIISAIPAERCAYQPHPRSRKALELAWHIAATEVWFLDGVNRGEFRTDEGGEMPAEMKTPADVAAWYDKNFAAYLSRVENLAGEHLSKPVSFYTYNHPGVFYLLFLMKHSIHHRGQLAAYLRPMGAKVPNIYGGSADEPPQATVARPRHSPARGRGRWWAAAAYSAP
jgi:uncharacterized damage-inducible protein DinB